jgi:hypothetical protein
MITVALDRGLKPCIVADIARHSSLNSQAPYAKKPKTKSSCVKEPTSKGKSVSDLQKTIVLDETSRIQHVPTSNTYKEMEEDGDDFKMSVEEKKLLEKLLAKS